MKRVLTLLVLLAFLVGCPKPRPRPVSLEDTPEHHYLQGMLLVEKGKLDEAMQRFDRAIYLNPNYARAYAGKALVLAIRAGSEKDREHASIDIERALDMLKKAKKETEGDTDEFAVYVTAIRVYTEAHPEDWLDEAKDYYEDAMDLDEVKEGDLIYYQSRAAAPYFMGVAYYRAYAFRKAEDMLAKCISMPPSKWHDRANRLYKKVQKIVRASAEYTLTKVARKIAVKDRVGRGDVAALLVDELHLDRFFAGRIRVRSTEPKADFVPADVVNHMFRNEIMTVVKWHVRGLEPTYDPTTRAYLFKPDAPLTRKELALILEDLLIKITGDQSIATKYFGMDHSPFPDVPPTVPWFNAVMNVVSRGLMEPELSGEFRPNDYVDGAELILAVMKLRNVLHNY